MAYQEVLGTDTPNEGRTKLNANGTELYARDATFTAVASEAAMIALSAKKGDVAIRTDLTPDAAFRLRTDDPTLAANWTQISGFGGAGASAASETTAGIAEIATQAETNTGTDDARMVTPLKLANYSGLATPDATETVKGKAEVATQAETDAGTDDARIVTPLKLANYSGLGGGSGSRTLVTLGSDVSTTGSAFVDATGLSFSVLSGTTYRFYILIIYSAAAASTGAKWGLNGPATDLLGYTVEAPQSASVQVYRPYNTFEHSDTAYTSSAYTSGNIVVIQGILHTTASGTVIVRFGSEIVGSAVTVKAGSTVEYW